MYIYINIYTYTHTLRADNGPAGNFLNGCIDVHTRTRSSQGHDLAPAGFFVPGSLNNGHLPKSRRNQHPMSSKYGTFKPVKARFWNWPEGQSRLRQKNAQNC